jgi:RNA methyltransferase, TrmH family
MASDLTAFRDLIASEGRVRLDGLHAVKHAVRFGARDLQAVTADRNAALSLAAQLAPDVVAWLEEFVVTVTADELRSLTQRPVPTGVIASARRPDPIDLNLLVPDAGPMVVLENPRHLGNVGAVIRVAAAAGASAVITTGTADPWHPQCISGSAGLHFALPVQRVDTLNTVVATGRTIVALHPEGDTIRARSIPPGSALIFGTERSGLSGDALALVDSVVSLPMRAGVSSLNLATSVAATLYLLQATVSS